MKGNKKILVIAALLLLIAACYTTYAIYKTSVGVNASLSAAAWNVAFKDGQTTLQDESTITFSSADCDNTHVAAGKIAPSYSCSKDITLDASGTEVDIKYTVSAGDPALSGGTYPEHANTFSATITGGGEGTLLMSGSQTATITVELTWEGDLDDTATVNADDILLEGETITVPLTLVARQFVASES